MERMSVLYVVYKRVIPMARYGSQEYPFTETMKPKPVDPYAISKVAAEQVLINLCELMCLVICIYVID